MILALDVVPLPVADVDRAPAFYTEQAGFTIDYHPHHAFRVAQLTPPGSPSSVQLVAADSTGRVHNLYLVTPDLAAEQATRVPRSWPACTVQPTANHRLLCAAHGVY